MIKNHEHIEEDNYLIQEIDEDVQCKLGSLKRIPTAHSFQPHCP